MVYFEISHAFKVQTLPGVRWIQPGIYYARGTTHRDIPIKTIGIADRIWIETDGAVSYIKNTKGWPGDPVPPEEFCWIKLAAKKLGPDAL